MAATPAYLNLVLNHSASGNQTLIAAVAARRIRVHQLFLVATGAVAARFDSTTATPITGVMSFAANGGIVLPFSEKGWFETVKGELLNLNLSGAVAVSGGLKYSVIP